MGIADFFQQYANEQSCKDFFKQKREAAGLSCKKCSSINLYWISKENRWRCNDCRHPMGLKYGTIMENSNLGYRLWLWGLYLMSLTKKGFSALEMQRLIGHKRYEPVWLMMEKIRISMGHRDEKYSLDGFIEMDEGFFEGHRKREIDSVENKAVKELDRQVKVIVAVSTKPAEEEQRRQYCLTSKAGFIKMSVVSSLCSKEVSFEAKKMVQKSATIITDGRRCYKGLKDFCTTHNEIIVKDKKEVVKVFPWVHIAISNAKKKILGLHHQVKDEYMQNYLSEFCYKFNRRFFGENLFDRLVVAAMERTWYKPNYG